MQHNESTFCSLWTKKIKVDNCADLFINEKFSDDYFFNRVNNILSCHDISAVLERSLRIFSERGLKSYIYDDGSNILLERIILERRFTQLDTMHAFRSVTDNIQHENHEVQVYKIDITLLPLWIDVFCVSFDALEWKPEVERILKLHFNELTLLIAYVKGNLSQLPAGCAVLFNMNKITGLYCLGTVPSFRHQGVAKKIIKVSLEIATQEDSNSLIVQAFTNEGFQNVYKRVGFELVYKTKIYMF